MIALVEKQLDILVRAANHPDAGAIAAIYDEGIAERTSTFETEPRSSEDIGDWLWSKRHVVLVAEDRGGQLVGWARTAPYSPRPCYAGVAEASVYVARSHRGHGIGTALTTALARHAERVGLDKLLGRLFVDNAASRALVSRCGFREVGVHLRHGRLDERWRDVLLVERLLGEAARDSAG
jgi:L-amino acid N-acyltransferase YncA